jgi:ABC-type glycerol-3-phosphate transport system permease component
MKTGTISAILLVVTIVTIAPLIWMLLASFKTPAQIFSSPLVVLPPSLYLDNYKAILLGSESRLPFLWNSLVISLLSTALVMCIAAPAAFGFAKLNVRHSDRYELWILSTRMMPPIAALIPISMIIRQLGMFDTKTGIILVYCAFNLPYAVWMLTIFLRQLPREMDEAAMLDGCSWRKIFLRISLPLIIPTFFTVAIFVFLFSWNEMLGALILSGRRAKTLPVAITEYAGGIFIRWELMSAAAVLQIIPAVFVVILFNKYIVSGLTMGSVKG